VVRAVEDLFIVLQPEQVELRVPIVKMERSMETMVETDIQLEIEKGLVEEAVAPENLEQTELPIKAEMVVMESNG
jgi:hypothetical protein